MAEPEPEPEPEPAPRETILVQSLVQGHLALLHAADGSHAVTVARIRVRDAGAALEMVRQERWKLKKRNKSALAQLVRAAGDHGHADAHQRPPRTARGTRRCCASAGSWSRSADGWGAASPTDPSGES